jgi:hypothetical protein
LEELIEVSMAFLRSPGPGRKEVPDEFETKVSGQSNFKSVNSEPVDDDGSTSVGRPTAAVGSSSRR